MTISMIGIDHGRAPVDIRALFAFTKKNAGEAMEKLEAYSRHTWLCDSFYLQPPGNLGKP